MSELETLNRLIELRTHAPQRPQVSAGQIAEVDNRLGTAAVAVAGSDEPITCVQHGSGQYLRTGDLVMLFKPHQTGPWVIGFKIADIGTEDFTSIVRVGTQPVPPEDTTVGVDADRVDAPSEVGTFLFVAYRTVPNGPMVIDWFSLDAVLQAMVGQWPSGGGDHFLRFTFAGGQPTARGWVTPVEVLTTLIPYRSGAPPLSGRNGNMYLDSSL